MNKIDLLIINNCPAFYKINLYNKLHQYCKIYVIFVGLSDQVVIENDFEKKIKFPFSIINKTSIKKRNKLTTLTTLLSIVRHYSYDKIIYGGWDLFELKILILLTSKRKNCLQSESSIHESITTGYIATIKKILLTKISTILTSGKLQSDVFKALKYKGKYIETGGVGIFNKNNTNNRNEGNKTSNFRYLYVGRLIPKKNLKYLIETFNRLGSYLTIVGRGEQFDELKRSSNSNIHFVGFVPNNKINQIYHQHDVFILPSKREPWGLVIEEAIYYGLPVIVSSAVGCQEEMVNQPQTGITFDLKNENSLNNAIKLMEQNYSFFKKNVLNFDFEQRDRIQVDAYLALLEK